MTIPYTFAGATTAIPLAQLDANFASPITLGNVAMTLSNTYTSIGNLTLTNVTVSSGNVAVTNANVTTLTATNDASISGLTVGKGGGSVASNTAVGVSALVSNTSGASNQAFGSGALSSNTTGGTNSAFAQQSLGSNSTGSSNSAFGYQALVNNTTASNNTAVGYQAGYSNTATGQVFVGFQAGYATTTGAYNTAIGGADNTGLAAMRFNTTGQLNVAVGAGSLANNTTASNNTAVGFQAGYSQTGSNNTHLGYVAGYSLTTGQQNTFVGYAAGYGMTTGGKNTILGSYSGNQGGLDIRTASNYIVLSDGDGNPRAFIDNTGTLLVGTTGNTGSNNKLVVESSAASWNVVSKTLVTSGNSYCGMLATFGAYSPNNTSSFFFQGSDTTTQRFQVYSNGGIANYSANNVNLSDKTLKKDITLAPSYLDKLCQIPVKTYLYNDQTDSNLNLGVIAQDVQAICPELVGTMDIGEIDSPNIKLAIYETDLKYAMLKAIQELKAEVDSLKQQLGK